MAPLFFIDPDKAEKLKAKKAMVSVFDAVNASASELVHAERCYIYAIDRATNSLYAEYTDPGSDDVSAKEEG